MVLPSLSYGTTWSVKDDGTGDYRTISGALTASSTLDGDTIEVSPGTYQETVNFLGKDVRVIGVAGAEATIIDGSLSTALPPVLFTLNESAAAEISGFTITNGKGSRGAEGQTFGGGIYVTYARPTIQDVIVTGNSASYGGGIACTLTGDPTLRNVIIEDNYASAAGGGIWVSNADPSLSNVIIRNNYTTGSSSDGGGLYGVNTDGVFSNLLIHGNRAVRYGGGAYLDGGDATLSFATLVANSTSSGMAGGLYVGSSTPLPVVHSLIIYGNQTYGLYLSSDGIYLDYCDLYSNVPEDYEPSSVISDGINNLSADPEFVAYSSDGNLSNDDFHLASTSPAVDAGAPTFEDLDGTRADMGFYGGPNAEGSEEPRDQDGDGLPDSWEETWGTDPTVADADQDPDGDGLTNEAEYNAETDPLEPDTDADGVSDGVEVGAGQDPTDPSDNRPTASVAASSPVLVGSPVTLDGSGSSDPNGDPLIYQWELTDRPVDSQLTSSDLSTPTEVVSSLTPDVDGVYEVALTVSDGFALDEAVVRLTTETATFNVPADYATIQAAMDAATDGDVITVAPGTYVESLDFQGKALQVIAASGAEDTWITPLDGPAVRFTGQEGTDAVLQGFTLSGGTGLAVDGLRYGGGIYISGASPSILECVILDSSADYGGGVAVLGVLAAPVLRSLRVEGNTVSQEGGGLYFAEGAGGGLEHSWIMSNVSTGSGGGVFIGGSEPELRYNVIAGNRVLAEESGGGGVMASASANPLLINNTIAYNQGQLETGGALEVSSASGEYRNNILAFSSAGYGYYPRQSQSPSPIFAYNDVYGNASGEYFSLAGGDLTGVDGNLSVDPSFMGVVDDGDFTNDVWVLAADSPLIDAGDSSLSDPDGSISDMGAYGGPEADPSQHYGDGDGDGLPDWWELLYVADGLSLEPSVDDDGDGLSNAEEYALLTDPTASDTDGDGLEDGEEVALGDDPNDPTDHQPVAVISAPAYVLPGESVAVDGSGSYDPNGEALSYRWGLTAKPEGSTVSGVSQETGASLTFVPDLPGIYIIQLVVNDGTVDSLVAPVEVVAMATYRVPGDYPTIQLAIDTSEDGTRILVGAGTYTETLDFRGKAITVTTTEGAILNTTEEAAVVTFKTGEGPYAVLEGFTITGGRGALRSSVRYGGGIYMENASPTLLGLSLTGNQASYGGAIACRLGGEPLLRGLSILGNEASIAGGGLYTNGCTPQVEVNTFLENLVTETGGGGGAIAVVAGDGVLANNLILGNQSAGSGGGIYLDDASPDVLNNTLVGNSSPDAGGLYALEGASFLLNNLILFSSDGVGVSLSGSLPLTLHYNDLFGNADGPFGGGQSDVLGEDGNLAVDPLFVAWSDDGDFGNDDFHLSVGSPVVDAGDPEVTDPDGSRSDLGVYGGTAAVYLDLDGDGSSTWAGDCDDGDPSVGPDQEEVPDGIDNNCDGQVDEGMDPCADGGCETPTPAPTPLYNDPDVDDDGDGFTENEGDCDDDAASVNPDANDIPRNGVDDDCDGCVDATCSTGDDDDGDDDVQPSPSPTPVPTPTPTPQPEPSPVNTPIPWQEDAGGCSCRSAPAGGPGGSVVWLMVVAAWGIRRRHRGRRSKGLLGAWGIWRRSGGRRSKGLLGAWGIWGRSGE